MVGFLDFAFQAPFGRVGGPTQLAALGGEPLRGAPRSPAGVFCGAGWARARQRTALRLPGSIARDVLRG